MDETYKDSGLQQIAMQHSKGLESGSQEISVINSEQADSDEDSNEEEDHGEEYDVFDMQSSEDYMMGDESLSIASSSELPNALKNSKIKLKKEKSHS